MDVGASSARSAGCCEKKQQGSVKLDVQSGLVTFEEIVSGEVYMRDGGEVRNTGLFVQVGAWGF